MITWLNHIAIAVPDLAKAAAQYELLGARVSEPLDSLERGLTMIVVSFPNCKIELLHPLGDVSPIAKYLKENPRGGIHHVCFEVENIDATWRALRQADCRILGDGDLKTGTRGKPIIMVHPDDFQGVLLEFEQM